MSVFLRLIAPTARCHRLINVDQVSDATFLPSGHYEDDDTGKTQHFKSSLFLVIGWGETADRVTLNDKYADAAARALGLVDPPEGGEACVTAQITEPGVFRWQPTAGPDDWISPATVGPDGRLAPPAPPKLEARIDDALLHYSIGSEADAALLPVDWRYVSRRMAEALRGADDQGEAAAEAGE